MYHQASTLIYYGKLRGSLQVIRNYIPVGQNLWNLLLTTGQHPGVSHITFLHIIDLSPTDESCIYSTLVFIEQQAKILNITTPCITFNQPLGLKSVEIVKAKSLKIVCRLGGFHLLISFLGSIGTMMECSGIAEALETVW